MIEDALYTRLTISTILAIATGGVYSTRLPQGCALPAVSFHRVSTERDLHMTGAVKNAVSHFQISCWADNPKTTKSLAAAVRAALHAYSGTVGTEVINYARIENEIELPGLEDREFHTAVYCLINHKET